MTKNSTPVIKTNGLQKYFPQQTGLVHSLLGGEEKWVKAVNGVDIQIHAGETVGVIGESGCGKSTLGEVLIGLQEATDGTVFYEGKQLSDMTKEELKAFRRSCQMIFQDPYESINPRYTVQKWVAEPLEIHGLEDREERVIKALERAELTPAQNYLDEHPHQLSGGERQRVSIARALVLEPTFIVADEPVSMLDVSIRASILNLLKNLVEELEMAALYISHDLSLIRQMCDRTNVMYLGKVVEHGDTERLIKQPKHPYTQALVDSVPVPDPARVMDEAPVMGEPPDPVDLPEGCNFRPRCPYAEEQCFEEPTLAVYDDPDSSREVSCWRVDEIAAIRKEAAESPIDGIEPS